MTAKLIKKNAQKPTTSAATKKVANPAKLRDKWLSERKVKSDQTSELRRKLFGR